MAAYASAVTLYTPNTQRISRNLGLLAGQLDITNYNSTTTEETDITRHFIDSGATGLDKGIVSLQTTSSENGYVFGFDKTTGKFIVYEAGADGAALDEVADDTDVGTVDFIAIGFIGGGHGAK